MVALPQYVIDLLQEIGREEGFVEPIIDIAPESGNINGFAGVLTKVSIIGRRRSSHHHETDGSLHLLCKLAPSNQKWLHELDIDRAFEREALMYNEILPLMAKFQSEKGLTRAEGFSVYPKCYKTIVDKEENRFVIILEDLTPQGFILWPKCDVIPAKHAWLLVEQLAKLHAVSFAMRDQRPQAFEQLRNVKDRYADMGKKDSIMKMAHMGYDKALLALSDPHHIKIVSEYRAHTYEYVYSCLQDNVCEPFGAITHGDCWINNLLFRYNDGPTDPTDVFLIDWQISRFSSPVLDLHFITATSTDKEFRTNYYKDLMKHYHNCLARAIRRLGSEPENLYPFDCFENDLRKFGNFAILMGILITQVLLTEIPKGDELTEEITNSESKTDMFICENEAITREYNKRILDLVTDFVDYGYFTQLKIE